MEEAPNLGYVVNDDEKYPALNYRVVTISSSIPDLAQFAIDNGTTYKMLRILNPWIRGRSLSVSGGKTYQVKLPQTNKNGV
jgi:membrane-bound lytic murein transglycosylase D